jgi:hypothetical protein
MAAASATRLTLLPLGCHVTKCVSRPEADMDGLEISQAPCYPLSVWRGKSAGTSAAMGGILSGGRMTQLGLVCAIAWGSRERFKLVPCTRAGASWSLPSKSCTASSNSVARSHELRSLDVAGAWGPCSWAAATTCIS